MRKRLRMKIRGTAERPRVHVFKSNRYVYVQAVDDTGRRILAAATTLETAFREKNPKTKSKDACRELGTLLAERLKSKQVDKVVFDRGVSPYHGRIKVLAEAMRQAGLVF
ncbi:MAG: 50S ribosomal protein L18 [Candidatus Aminicenantes bacterium RBG_13_62_12]|nr:MAG: 50S ribosomal protein L18 [Candidatus Aminicenantes bacterium RBG_13_62_12]